MGDFWETFFGIFLRWWWAIALVVLSPYLFYFLTQGKNKNIQKKDERRDDFFNPKTEEEKYLGINILKSELPHYNKRIESIISSLKGTTGRVSISAVEAILLVEHFSERVVLNQNGELVIDFKTSQDFCQKIYDDPMAFITYIKAVENQIDLGREQNKIELGTILYMMRNAKKFGLYNDDDTEFSFKIKSAIHSADYKDVIINIIDDTSSIDYNENEIQEQEYVLININEEHDKQSQKTSEQSFKKIEKLDGSKIKITMNDDYEIIKDDLQIYSIIKPELIEVDRENLNKNEDISKDVYFEKFGALDKIEISSGQLRDRSLFHFEEQLVNKVNFNINKNKNATDSGMLYFFDNEDFYHYFFAYLFDKKYATGLGVNFIFLGQRELRDNKNLRFLSLDAHYFFNLLYAVLRRENRESFFKFIFKDDFALNIDNANLFLTNLNKNINLFFQNNNGGYLAYAIYEIGGKNIKSLIIRIDIGAFEDLMNLNTESTNEIVKKYRDLKKSIDGVCKSVSFGQTAEKEMAHITLKHDSFFRIPKNELI